MNCATNQPSSFDWDDLGNCRGYDQNNNQLYVVEQKSCELRIDFDERGRCAGFRIRDGKKIKNLPDVRCGKHEPKWDMKSGLCFLTSPSGVLKSQLFDRFCPGRTNYHYTERPNGAYHLISVGGLDRGVVDDEKCKNK